MLIHGITASKKVAAPAGGWDITNAVYANKSAYVGTEAIQPYGVIFGDGGTKMYITNLANDTIYQYTLSTAWDVSTATYANKSYPATEDTTITSCDFSLDGTKMYIIGLSTDAVYQYTLSTAWDVSTATYANKSAPVGGQEGIPLCVRLGDSGTKMYVVGNGTDTVYQYNMSVAWDVGTATYANKSHSVGGQDNQPYGVHFSTDGTKMFIAGIGTDTVYQYTLSTSWDIGTVSYDTISFAVTQPPSTPTPRELAFSSDGTKLYIVDESTTVDTVFQYTL